MARYRLTRKADADLASLYRHGVTTFGMARADRYFDSLIRRFADIAEAPFLFPESDYRDGYRRSVHSPYAIYFRMIDPDLVEIVRILRGQDPREALQGPFPL